MSNHCQRGLKLLLGAFLVLSANWFDAARNGDVKEIVQMLKSDSKLLNSKNEKGYTGIVLASYNGQRELTHEFLKLGADPCLTDNKGNSALMGVIFKGHQEIITDLMDKCDVNLRNNEGQTALMYASLFGREKVAGALLRRGANKDLQDNEGRTAITLAEGQWNQAMVGFLKTFRIIK